MTSQNTRRKTLERHYLDVFLSLQGWTAIIEDSEQPDFLLGMDDQLVGVEVTQLLKDEESSGSQAKRTEQTRSRFLADVSAQYYEAAGRPVSLKANLAWPIDSAMVPQLITRLRELRDTLAPWERATMKAVGRSTFYLCALPNEMEEYDRWQVVNNSVGWVRKTPARLLTAKIREKALLLPEYRKKARRIVLLIVANRTQESGMFEIEPSSDLQDACGFAEVYLLLHPLRVERVAEIVLIVVRVPPNWKRPVSNVRQPEVKSRSA